MKISQMLSTGQPLFSFEFFPPKDEPAAAALFETIIRLKQLKPDFVSVTYGAGGSTRAKTLALVARIKHEIGMEAMAHLTCVGHSKAEIREILKELSGRGIENIIALRGDPPKGETAFQPHPDGFQHADELVEEAARMGFCVAVAGYPEKHPEARSLPEDLRRLKGKVDAGASLVITQLFFHNAHYFDFVAQAKAIGIRVPIIAGLMPVTNFAQIQRFTAMCGATLPSELAQDLAAAPPEDAGAATRIGIRHAAQQGEELLRKGASGIHFYTLNKSHATQEVLDHLRKLRKPLQSGLLRDV